MQRPWHTGGQPALLLRTTNMTFLTKVKNTVSSLALNYAKDTQGNFAVVAAITMVVMIGGVAAAVDIGGAVSAKQRLQDTSDQIALYAARSLETDPAALTQHAMDYFDYNYADGSAPITLNSIERVGDTVNVDLSSSVDTSFAGIFGVSQLPVRVNSSSTFSDRGLDIALVLDTTGSMGDPSSGGGTKIETLRAAGTSLIEELDTGTPGKVRISVVPFAQYVNVGTANLDANWLDDSDAGNNWSGCVGSRTGNGDESANHNGRDFPAIEGDLCNSPITPLTANLDTPKAAMGGLVARGWTYMPAGLVWGWRTLEGGAPFSEADDNGGLERDRIVIMMTDGANTRAVSGTTHNSKSSNKADRATEDVCSAIKSDDIQIYTIAYEISETKTRRLLEDCASGGEQYFDARNADDLTAAFAEIAANLSTLRLTN